MLNNKLKITFLFIISLIISYFHWVGLFIGGIIAGLFASNVKRALFYGFLFGFIVWFLFIVDLASMGLLNKYLSMEFLTYISLILPVTASMLASLIRAIV